MATLLLSDLRCQAVKLTGELTEDTISLKHLLGIFLQINGGKD